MPTSAPPMRHRRNFGVMCSNNMDTCLMSGCAQARGCPTSITSCVTPTTPPEPPEFAARLASAPDPTPLLVKAAVENPATNPLCAATLQIFVAILGAEAGNLAVKVLATDGVYLAGGIPKRILPLLEDGRFMHAFVNKGRFADLLMNIPVHVIVSQAALLGAVFYGFDRLLTAIRAKTKNLKHA